MGKIENTTNVFGMLHFVAQHKVHKHRTIGQLPTGIIDFEKEGIKTDLGYFGADGHSIIFMSVILLSLEMCIVAIGTTKGMEIIKVNLHASDNYTILEYACDCIAEKYYEKY